MQAPDNGANYRINYRKLMERLENAHRSKWRQLTEPIGESSRNQSEKHYKTWKKATKTIEASSPEPVGESSEEHLENDHRNQLEKAHSKKRYRKNWRSSQEAFGES